MEAYCVKCKEKREMENTAEVTMKNGRLATKGTCPVCGTGMFRIMGKAKAAQSPGVQLFQLILRL